jgi:hypothetical protein
MEYKRPTYTSSESDAAHKRAQAAIDHATEVRLGAAETRNKTPHLIDDGGIKRCSVCKFPFHPDVKPSLTVAFTEHLAKAHRPGQTREDVNQAAARIVREATDNK